MPPACAARRERFASIRAGRPSAGGHAGPPGVTGGYARLRGPVDTPPGDDTGWAREHPAFFVPPFTRAQAEREESMALLTFDGWLFRSCN